MIVLYQFATSPFCEKVRRILNFKGAEYRVHEVDRGRVAELKSISPYGKFPALEHDGHAVWDSTNIAHYLEGIMPEPALIPDGVARGLVHVLEDWADESLYFYEVTMRLSWEHNIDRVLPEFVATMPGATPEAIRARLLERTKAGTTTQGIGRKQPADVVADVDRHFCALETLLRASPWLAGDRISLADIAVASQVAALIYAREAQDLFERRPTLQAWLSAVDAAAPPAAPQP